MGRARGQEVQTLQGKWRRPQHSGELLCPDTNRGVLFLLEHERGGGLSPDQRARA
jgi:hypothetical protein